MFGLNPISSAPISALADVALGATYTLVAETGYYSITGYDATFTFPPGLISDFSYPDPEIILVPWELKSSTVPGENTVLTVEPDEVPPLDEEDTSVDVEARRRATN